MDDKARWETVANNAQRNTARLRVPGGWLYREQYFADGPDRQTVIAMAFVPAEPAAERRSFAPLRERG